MPSETEIIHALSKDAARRAVEVLAAGGLVAFPTDTVYGVAALPWNPEAVARLYEAKQRPCDRAVPLLLSDADQFCRVATVPDWFQGALRRLTARFWPGGLTIVVPKTEAVLDQVSAGPTVAVRVPGLLLARELIGAAGGVLAVTSANISGQPNPVTAHEVEHQLGGRIDLILDGGACPGGVPSTVLDCTVCPPRTLRHGIISDEALSEVMALDGDCPAE
jgi:L-threonylcarbamoyladenylate synthase